MQRPLHLPSLLLLLLCSTITAVAQTAKPKTVTDSNKNLIRKEHAHAALDAGQAVMPLKWYNFQSEIVATFTFADSQQRVTSNTAYHYWFDKAGLYMGVKEEYAWKGKKRSAFRIEELKDSVGFKANLGDSLPALKPFTLHLPAGGHIFRQNNPAAFQPSGRRKEMNGYLCAEYIMDNEQLTNTIWVTVTKDPLLQLVRSDLRYAVYNELTAYTEGIVMYSECYYKQTKHTQRFEVTAVNAIAPRRVVTKGLGLLKGF